MATVIELLTRVAAFEHAAADAVKVLEDLKAKLVGSGVEAEVVAVVETLKKDLDGILHTPTASGQAAQEQPGNRPPVANAAPVGEHAPGGEVVSTSVVQAGPDEAAAVEAAEQAAAEKAADEAAAKDAEAKAAADAEAAKGDKSK